MHPILIKQNDSEIVKLLKASSVACTVKSNDNVATFIKELVLELPEREKINYRAGGYIQIECPPHIVNLMMMKNSVMIEINITYGVMFLM
jgi:Na+-transporting NADH:ubiquinone oxidoreductase subunit NqrF